MRILDISPENRPRERLQKLGSAALSEAELLAIIFKTGTKKDNVLDVSNKLIGRYGFHKLAECSFTELQAIDGIGPAKASQVMAMFELFRRHKPQVAGGMATTIKSPKDVLGFYAPTFEGLKKETFLMVMLNVRKRVIRDEVISIGSLSGTVVHPREVFRPAIKESAHSIIMVHNHPSGDPSPSEEDRDITSCLSRAGKLLDIPVVDHVILAGGGKYYSFRESGGRELLGFEAIRSVFA